MVQILTYVKDKFPYHISLSDPTAKWYSGVPK